MEFRRRVPRQIAGWVVRCRIDDGPVDEARECRVLDISEFGVRILLHHPRGSELIGRHVSIETPKRGASPNIRLEGEVRNAAGGRWLRPARDRVCWTLRTRAVRCQGPGGPQRRSLESHASSRTIRLGVALDWSRATSLRLRPAPAPALQAARRFTVAIEHVQPASPQASPGRTPPSHRDALSVSRRTVRKVSGRRQPSRQVPRDSRRAVRRSVDPQEAARCQSARQTTCRLGIAGTPRPTGHRGGGQSSGDGDSARRSPAPRTTRTAPPRPAARYLWTA